MFARCLLERNRNDLNEGFLLLEIAQRNAASYSNHNLDPMFSAALPPIGKTPTPKKETCGNTVETLWK